MIMKKYILNGRFPVAESDIIKWAQWYEKADRVVKKTKLPSGEQISTVFLGLDHSFSEGVPLLFETMIFGGDHDKFQERYSTWDEAEAGHNAAIAMIFEVNK